MPQVGAGHQPSSRASSRCCRGWKSRSRCLMVGRAQCAGAGAGSRNHTTPQMGGMHEGWSRLTWSLLLPLCITLEVLLTSGTAFGSGGGSEYTDYSLVMCLRRSSLDHGLLPLCISQNSHRRHAKWWKARTEASRHERATIGVGQFVNRTVQHKSDIHALTNLDSSSPSVRERTVSSEPGEPACLYEGRWAA